MLLKFVNKIRISSQFTQELVKFISIKIDTANRPSYFDSYAFQFARVLKYIFKQTSILKPFRQNEVSLSLPYYVKDALENKANVQSITDIKINLFNGIEILFLFLFLSISDLNVKKRAHVIGVLSIAVIYYKCIVRSDIEIVHFHRYAFVPEIAAFMYLISEDSLIESHFHESGSFLNNNLVVKTNVLHHNNEISSKYAERNKDRFLADDYRFELSINDMYKFFQSDAKKHETIGIYSSGNYCRTAFNPFNKAIVSQGVIREQNMFAQILDYAKQRETIEFIIFPHYSRGIETYEGALDHYSDILKLENVTLAQENVRSSNHHENIDLGITVISYVFWDRLFSGQKTILIDPHHIDNFVNDTSLANVTLHRENGSFNEDVDRFFCINNEEYFRLLL